MKLYQIARFCLCPGKAEQLEELDSRTPNKRWTPITQSIRWHRDVFYAATVVTISAVAHAICTNTPYYEGLVLGPMATLYTGYKLAQLGMLFSDTVDNGKSTPPST